MSHIRLTSLTMLLIATVAPAARAQTPPATKVDSAKADSVAPKKSRFGGLMNKAKQVAGSKAGQKANELAHSDAVKGAAVGVACTVVPGAAVAGAVTGKGACATNGLMSGLVSGNLKGTAAAMASGVASNGASGTAAKLMSKGGITGAAARGALGAVGGSGAMSNMAAQAAAMQIMAGSGRGGMSDAAAATAAMKAMQAQGMSAAAAAAMMQGMAANPGASGMTPASAAAAMNMLKGMKIPKEASNAAAMVPGTLPAAAPTVDMSKAYYDEVNDKGHMVAQLVFSPGTDRLKLESQAVLQQIASMMDKHGKLKIRIEGHTDNVGSADANLALSDKRAQAVKASLIEDYHIKADRIDAKGFGGAKPAFSNDTPEGRSSNWRIELVKM